MTNPWMKFYPTDWRSAPELRNCGAAARGLWVEMLCVMHEATPYGHLLVNGEPPNDAQLASQTGIPFEQVTGLLGELEKNGVFSRNAKGVIYSRRMVRDEKKANLARKNGKGGGNPTLGSKRGNSSSDNPKDNPKDKPRVKAQKPDTRDIPLQGGYIDGEASTPSRGGSAPLRKGCATPPDQPWYSAVCEQLGQPVAVSWFADARKEGNRLIFPNEFKANYVRNNYGQALRAMMPGITITTKGE